MAGDTNVATALATSLNILKYLSTGDSKQHVEHFRSVITNCQKLSSTPNALLPPCLGEMAELLITKLVSAQPLSSEARSLCGVAFALVLCTISEPNSVALMYSKTFLTRCSEDNEVRLILYKGGADLHFEIPQDDVASFQLFLTYGLLQAQSSFWASTIVSQANWSSLLISRMFPLIETECFAYTSRTLLSFKCLLSWINKMKQCSLDGRLTQNLSIRIMNIISSNWENPFNGVREQNSLILEQFLDITLDSTNDEVPSLLRPPALLELVLNEMSWMMKSKYFLLSAILPKASPTDVLEEHAQELISGLITSLGFTHLVSAGTELYRVCLEFTSYEKWLQLFLPSILTLISTSPYTLSKMNVFNYWIVPTMKVYRQSLDQVYDGLVYASSTESSEDLLLTLVMALKTGRKEGCEMFHWERISKLATLSEALIHSNDLIRANGFATVCLSSKTKTFPKDEEFRLVIKFLEENVNSDSTPLRRSLITSFTVFLVRVKDACLQCLREEREAMSVEKSICLSNAMRFLECLYNFLISCLEVGSNYQRKITALELYKVVLSHLSNESGNGGAPTATSSSSGSRGSSFKIPDGQRVMKHAIAVGKWGFTSEAGRECLLYCISDSSEDVREIASYLLVGYFKMADPDLPRFATLFNKGLTLCSDQLFYNVGCGSTFIYTIAHLAYKGPTRDVKCLGIKTDRVCSTLLPIAENQAVALKNDLLNAATTGSPLYGVLEALNYLVGETSSPEFKKLSHAEGLRLMTLIESVSHHLLQVLASKSSTTEEYEEGYVEMSQAIDQAVRESSVTVEDSDSYQMSPSYQLILNTIWLNLKACCSLASTLFNHSGCDAARCLTVILSVLRQARHKGALESAGSSLAQLTRQLVGTPDGRNLLDDALMDTLDRLAEDSSESTRGAGLVVLVHRLVANDTRPGKPMAVYCLNYLIDVVEGVRNGQTASALHVLAVLLKDSSLVQETAKVIHRLAAACFSLLSHASWPVRNTALQLFGAIVPRLVGQRKSIEVDGSCSCYHLAYEELYYHARPLLNSILEQLEKPDIAHTSLVPLLSLMSNLSLGILTIVDRQLATIFDRFVACFQRLMSSPVSKVRQLAAEANAWFCSPSQITHVVKTRVWKIVYYVNDRTLDNEIKSENDLHGFLLNTKALVNRFKAEQKDVGLLKEASQEMENSLEELRSISSPDTKLSFICRQIVAELVGLDSSHRPASKQIEALQLKPGPQHKTIGFEIWTETVTRATMSECHISALPGCLSVALNSSSFEIVRAALEVTAKRMEELKLDTAGDSVFNILLRTVARCEMNERDRESILELVLDLMPRNSAHNLDLSLDTIIDSMLSKEKPLMAAVAAGLLPLDQQVISNRTSNMVVDRLAVYARPTADVNTRTLAARGAVLLTTLFVNRQLDNSARSSLWHVTITLLEDEDSNVRKHATLLARAVIVEANLLPTTAPLSLNPQVALKLLLDKAALTVVLPGTQAAICLWAKLRLGSELSVLETAVQDARSGNSLNPFEAAAVDNMYAEPVKTATFAFTSLLSLLCDNPQARACLVSEVLNGEASALQEQAWRLQEFVEVVQSRLLVSTSWYIAGRKISYQFQVIQSVNQNSRGLARLNPNFPGALA